MTFLVFCLVVFGLTVVSITVAPQIKKYSSFCVKPSVKLSFKQLRDFYNLNHDGWRLEKDYAFRYINYNNETHRVHVRLSPIDYIKYRRWIGYKDSVDDKLTRVLLESVQADIDTQRAKAAKELDEASDRTQKLIEIISKQPSQLQI